MRFLSLILFLFFGFAPVDAIANFSRALPRNALDIIGPATATNSVTVNGNPTYRHGEFYQYPLPIPNASAPIWQSVSVAVSDAGLSTNGNILFPAYGQTFSYDLDGNRTADGVWNYSWDAENRLIQVSNTTSVASAARKKLDFSYDHLGRRYRKIVSTWSGSAWVTSRTNYFFHDGWLLVGETSPGSTTKTYLWGVDLSGLPAWRGNAAGVGGLVAMKYGSDSYYPAFDGNGNVMALVSSADGKVKAQYEYGPFAEAIRASGPMAELNPFRYSTKYTDDETGLSYYGYRFYNPSSGRWLNRDPFAEAGGLNLYGLLRNNPLFGVDPLGLSQEWHHLLPQEFVEFFDSVGIDIHESRFGIFLEENVHDQLHGLEDASYNSQWEKTINDIREGDLTRAERKEKALQFLEELREQPKIRCFLSKGVKVPEGLHYSEYSKMLPQEKYLFFKKLFAAEKAARMIGAGTKVVEFGGKTVKVAGIALTPLFFAEGATYAEDVYRAGPMMQTVSGVAQATLPLGPADSSATWDMTQAEVASGNTGWGALTETFLNPVSPRWLPWQIGRGVLEQLTK